MSQSYHGNANIRPLSRKVLPAHAKHG